MLNIDKLEKLEFNITTLCNSKCPGCIRTMILYPEHEENKKYIDKFPLTSISPELFESIAKGLGHHAQHVSAIFCGTSGDAISHPKIMDIIDITKKYYRNDTIWIETNGSIRNTDWWKALAQKNITVSFSIDGLEDTNHLYRINTDYNKIISNAKAYIDAGGTAEWKYIVFDHNKHQLDRAREIAKQMGFKKFSHVISKRFGNQVPGDSATLKVDHSMYSAKASTVDESIKQEGFEIKPMQTDDQQFNDTIKHATMLKHELDQQQHVDIDCRTYGDNYLFVDHFGQLWPCCFWSCESEQQCGETDLFMGDHNWNYWWNKFENLYGKNFNQLGDHNTIPQMMEHHIFKQWLPDSFDGKHDKCTVCISKCTANKTARNHKQQELLLHKA